MHLFWWQVTKQPALHQENTVSAVLLSTVGIFGLESPYHELALTVAAGPCPQQNTEGRYPAERVLEREEGTKSFRG